MTADELKSWRKAERNRLIAARENLDAATLQLFRQRIEAHLGRSFPGLAAAKLVFCWPIRGEYDARPLAQRLRECGAVTALPVVVAPGQPLVFREWHSGMPLASGPLGIPFPVGSDPVVPTAALLPMIGWDEAGYRLGYGGGFFDRTLASLAKKPVVIGVSYELGKVKTIRPQSWDIPMDWVVTERGVYRRDPEGLVFLGEADAGEPSVLASPVCYAAEIVPGSMGEDPMNDVHHVSVYIARRPTEVYEFASDPRNLPRWAAGLARSEVRKDGDEWIADAPFGKIRVRFARPNSFGVMDHDVTLESGVTIHNPMRVVPNGAGSEFVFTLIRQPGMSDGQFAKDKAAVEADLKTLKDLLERTASS